MKWCQFRSLTCFSSLPHIRHFKGFTSEMHLEKPNSLSPGDTLEASGTEPALQRTLVKEPVTQRETTGWDKQRGGGLWAFCSGRDWDARL